MLTDVIPHDWSSLFRYLIASLIGCGVTYLVSRFTKKQTDANIDNTKADTRKRHAEATNLEVIGAASVGRTIVELSEAVGQITMRVERITEERDHWKTKASTLQAELNLANLQLNSRIAIGDTSDPLRLLTDSSKLPE